MADSTTLERLTAAVDRVEAATRRLRAERDRAAAQAKLLNAAGAEAIAAIDALLAEAK